jgi:hypothetical protein
MEWNFKIMIDTIYKGINRFMMGYTKYIRTYQLLRLSKYQKLNTSGGKSWIKLLLNFKRRRIRYSVRAEMIQQRQRSKMANDYFLTFKNIHILNNFVVSMEIQTW